MRVQYFFFRLKWILIGPKIAIPREFFIGQGQRQSDTGEGGK